MTSTSTPRLERADSTAAAMQASSLRAGMRTETGRVVRAGGAGRYSRKLIRKSRVGSAVRQRTTTVRAAMQSPGTDADHARDGSLKRGEEAHTPDGFSF